MWQTAEERLALLELLVRGTLKRRRAQAAAWDALGELPWTKRTGRRDELGLVESRRGELAALLDRVWPAWGAALAELIARGLPPTPDGWAALEDAQRAEGLPALPDQLNRRTAAALVAAHSKAALTGRRAAALGGIVTTHDGSVRLRPPEGLVARTPRGAVDLAAVAAVLGEVSLPERALKGGLELEGTVRAALLVENLGAFCDLATIEGWLFAHVPGWDTATVTRLLDRLTHVPVVHFGDLDPNGTRIFQHLRGARPDLRWFVPQFWEELVETKGRPCAWPVDLDVRDAPELVRRLAARDMWLEQEPVAVDPRTPAALEGML
ncbi:Wadjet anti-phage system protein JetD domain-containing protein [Sorangium sp. So ce204]|uniref:Wadjet anti-phage system protein JetD domain-containing protein n=1 Tax=Sorangium sp. So ce204 TaxID=3133288 RepID=UPI003F648F42